MDVLSGKRLLILGANPETIPLVQKANSMGIHTIVTDYTHGAPAKDVASESYDVDGSDVDALVALGKKLKIDGVLVGVADRLIVPYQQVCNKLGLPCYGTEEQCAVFTDKMRFNEECAKYGLKGIPSYSLDANMCEEIVKSIQYPVLIKPSDSNSGKGMTICYKEDELSDAVSRALSYSASKRFLTERYMTCDDIFVFYTFVDGTYWPSIIADRFTCKGQNGGSPVCQGARSPSKYADLFMRTVHPKLSKMFQSLQVKNGVLMISAFVENEEFYLYDPGFRLQGEAPNLTVFEMTGFNHLEMLLHFALTGENPYGRETLLPTCTQWGKVAFTIWYLLRPGRIKQIIGLERICNDPSVYQVVTRFEEGDVILPEFVGTESQVFARVYVSCNTFEQLYRKIDELQKNLCILDEEGRSMLLPGVKLHK